MSIGGEAYRKTSYTRPTVMSGSELITDAVELAVGAGCLAAGAGAWRRRALRWVAVLLLVAGLAAVVHAAVAIAT
jgi:hypothetical protein